MRDMKIRTAPGRKVRDPRTGQVLSGEVMVEASTHWLRRADEGDVLIVKPEPPITEAPEAPVDPEAPAPTEQTETSQTIPDGSGEVSP